MVGPVYADRAEGQFYLMRSQGLLPPSYLLSLSLYASSCQFAYTVLTLSALYVTPLFLPSKPITDETDDWYYYWYGTFGDPQQVVPTRIWNFEDTYKGQEVVLEAYRSPGGYGMLFGTSIVVAIAAVGQVLSTAFLPGNRIPMVLIMFITLLASVAPLMASFLPNSEEYYFECSNTTNPDFVCDSTFYPENVDSDFVDCVGFNVNYFAETYFCVPPQASLLPHFGFFQMLATTYTAKVTFISEPQGYVEDILVPSLSGVSCERGTCNFPFAQKHFAINAAWTLVGTLILIVIGISLAYSFVFSFGPLLALHQSISKFLCIFGGKQSTSHYERARDGNHCTELTEVIEERASIERLVSTFIKDDKNGNTIALDHKAIRKDELPPVVVHKLRKVFPALAGRPPKVALESLDLHVPHGQVLGLLGKNGAGKTTALKILAGAQEASSGIGLVDGRDCNLEKNAVFEKLGNCAQFDVVWKSRSVQQHLEFFAQLKGLPSESIKQCARAIAHAVGLGSEEIYKRKAGALSGGMRRRLSIAMAFIGSPSVVILDEPTTGLDPSTRAGIWSLINSFADQNRSMIITTHMMIEADSLCNRIAIVAHGKLVVVGTQQLLKDKFGDGYVLQLNLIHSTKEHQERAMAFVRKYLHSEARLRIRQAKTLHINLPRDINLEGAFTALYGPRRVVEGCINQFLLSQSSLEDVFIALGD